MNKCLWANEYDRLTCECYRKHWNDDTLRQGDIRNEIAKIKTDTTVDVLCGGDPCPSRSRARFGLPSGHPDLSGYFLALAGRLRPQWVVRENVCAPDVIDFAIGLEMLGYGVVVLELNAKYFTSQSRRRQFVVGCPSPLRAKFAKSVLDTERNSAIDSQFGEKENKTAACLLAQTGRDDLFNNFVHEHGRGIRVLDPIEMERLQGFPDSWTEGYSYSHRKKMLGNAVNVKVVKWIGERIMEVIGREFTFIELFAGVGGFRLGFEQAELKIAD